MTKELKVRPLADDFITLYKSEDPQNIYAYSPGICRFESGSLIF